EAKMPDIFRDMQGKSDKQILDDLHDYMFRLFIRDKRPVHIARIVAFLTTKVPADKVMRVIELAERSELIQREAGKTDLYIPRPMDHLPGVE
ncbi:MAG TPA: hypothetical protein VEC99_15090, partial [Clostridia bacterium]|nr:hypothetical protein [Clostridia bacterium]